MNKLSLYQLAHEWQGEDCFLVVRHNKIYTERLYHAHNSKLDKLISQGIGVFGNIAKSRSNSHWASKQNLRLQNRRSRQNSYGGEYVFDAKSKPRITFAEMGEQYCQERNLNIQTLKPSFPNRQCKYSFKFPNKSTENHTPSRFSPNNMNFNSKNKCQPLLGRNQLNENMEQIMQSIKEIKLPDCPNNPQYLQANRKFQAMKESILKKIMTDSVEVELNEILTEIQEAANHIIEKHKVPEAPQLKKNGVFSFNDMMVEVNTINSKGSLKKIQQVSGDQSNLIKLPVFQDDGANISSIVSDFGQRKDEEDSAKIENILIADADDIEQLRSESIKEMKIDEQLPSKQIEQASPFNVQESKMVNKSIKQSLKPQIISSSPKKQKIPSQLPEKDPFKFQIAKNEQSSLQNGKINESGEKSNKRIPKNLQEAKQIDPQIVKYTQYKLKFLQPRVSRPQIINVASPMRFCRKEQVVKHLVANQIVEKESNSIEF